MAARLRKALSRGFKRAAKLIRPSRYNAADAPPGEGAPHLAKIRVLARTGAFEKWVLLVLVAACLSSSAAPTAAALGPTPQPYHSLWSLRVGPANLIELGILIAAVVWLASDRSRHSRTAPLDGAMLILLLVAASAQVIALVRVKQVLLYQKPDLERIALVFAGYALVSRMRLSGAQLTAALKLVASALCLAGAYLTLRYGIIGSTEFATATGRKALLITEDTLLLLLPVIVLWGLFIDGRRDLVVPAVVLFIGVLTVDLLSLRRGATIFVVAAVVLRTLAASRRLIVAAVLSGLIAAAAVYALNPLHAIRKQVTYTAQSAAQRTRDASVSEFGGELKNYSLNASQPSDVLFGRGFGAAWLTIQREPINLASFGSRETVLVRLGWHLYGLDWLYKVGVVGAVLLLAAIAGSAMTVSRAIRGKRQTPFGSVALSLGILCPLLLLLALTNPRVAFFAGASTGFLSQLLAALRTAAAPEQVDGDSAPHGVARAPA